MPPVRHLRVLGACLVALFLASATARATAPGTGRLRIIHLDVGQGDGAVLISPNGEVAMFDDGTGGVGAIGLSVPAQLQALGVTSVEHHFCSHYHSDHLGGTPSIVAAGIPIVNGWDRGGSYTTTAYNNYVSALGSHRKTLVKNQVIVMDSLSAHPVILKCVDLGGAGQSSTEENTLSVVMKVSYGEFDMTFGGDLPGAVSGSYKNIESTIGPEVGGHIEVYKVHHHGSATSSLDDWLNATTPNVAVISCGNGNTYGHPTSAALTRLHNHGVHTYWTELGAGAAPLAGWDKYANGQITISATWEGAGVDTIRGNGFTDTFQNSGSPATDAEPPVATVTSPAGGETWKAGSLHAVHWTATDNVAVTSVDLAWSSDGGANWTPLASGIANSGSWLWTVPGSATTNGRVRVRARDAAGNLGADSSFSAFSVDWWTVAASAGTGGSITPTGVVNVLEGAGSGFTVSPLSGFAVQDLVVDGLSKGALPGWTFTGVTANHTIAASFLDVAAPVVTLGAPAGGESLVPGEPFDVIWNASDNLAVQSVDLDLSLTGADGPWSELAHGLANTGTWSWTVPSTPTDNAYVRVTARDATGNAAAAAGDLAFSIGGPSTAVGDRTPRALALAPPAPNPSPGAATMAFALPAATSVTLDVLDVAGRRVAGTSGAYGAGVHAWRWDGLNAAGERVGAGIYLVRLHTPQGTRLQRLVMVR